MTWDTPTLPATPQTLRLVPELAALAILDEAVTVAMYALHARYPGRFVKPSTGLLEHDTPEDRLYEALVTCCRSLEEYRLDVAYRLMQLEHFSCPEYPCGVVNPYKPDDSDIPF